MSEAASPPFAQSGPPPHPHDPWVWCLLVPAIFAALASIRLTIPSAPFFDEVHYLPAAREFLNLWAGEPSAYINQEHPLLGKLLIATGMHIFGDNPIGWRIMPLLAGVIAVGASMRALWHASHDRFATLAFGVLLVTGFHLFVHARIAMLDIFMAAFLALAAWQFAAAVREPETGRWRLALTGIAIGLALGAKWNAVPLACAFGLTFFAARLSAGRRRLLLSRRGIPVPGISLLEAFVWLGILPLAIYALTFAPGYWLGSEVAASPLAEHGLIAMHGEMLSLQQQVLSPHTYQSTWPQWVMNTRGIWYHYAFADGAQRGVLLIGNPLTTLVGLPALMWCLVSGLYRGEWAKIAVVIGYAISLGLWLIAPKPVQFYYHYIMPSLFLLAALALSLSDLREAGRKYWAYGVLLGSAAMFAVFFPILSAGALEGPQSFTKWAWIAGWR
ncbi:phospholipid carrier-dependent glycosyltransferase [uncultured Erythrobacter sp.]|uniref:phospholipid carrier-dependent glycosyltransferase n=1 Tax=uncultured Erythrobacter sp. TaxID=263913 RepID=UPI00260D9D39|nr:phospholipid carrier-dependent glycosyltransferase [uncultured Erythrobacter sp.]